MTTVVRELKDIIPPLQWEPIQGAETRAFVERKHQTAGIPKPALERVVFEAQQVLGRCANPHKPAASNTGLVVGYVQSGKTLSFTTLAALAHDNGFGLIILIAGTLNNLKEQSLDRLHADLALQTGGVGRPWFLAHNPEPDAAASRTLRTRLENWLNPEFPAKKKKVSFVVLLKHTKRISNLRDVLKGVDVSKVPTLIIDDEADQASLNSFAARNGKTGGRRTSANYAEVVALKGLFPHHTYVQYTATPQANLLIDLADTLSPDFAELVSPGEGYVGGLKLFAPGGGFARTIPADEVDVGADTEITELPSLMEAIKVYLLGACACEVAGKSENRTMMVHPSQQKGPHNYYLRLVDDLMSNWRAMMGSADTRELLLASFRDAYDDLQGTVGKALPAFEELSAHLKTVLETLVVREVNSTGPGKAPINWSDAEYWILVGGAKLDRGFTVEGLAVTYMPRPLATGHADSLQQRARFYGYKAKYLGYCRVYLQGDVRDAFESYVEHEEDIHTSLKKERGRPLKEWKRQFILDARLKPTRPGVVSIPLTPFIAQHWMEPAAAHVDQDKVNENRTVLDKFVSELNDLSPGTPAHQAYPELFIDKRAGSRPNMLFEQVPMEKAIAFLEKLSFGTSDDETLRAATLLALSRLRASGETYVDVFVMANLESSTRSLKKNANEINQVAQGRSPAGTTKREDLTYGGDRSFVTPDRVTLHLRRFNLKDPASDKRFDGVPWYGVHIPENLGKRFLLQDD